MIDEKKLRKKIKRVEEIHKCSLHFESAKKLIEKVQEEYRQGMSRESFVHLVNRWAKKLELCFNYCRVTFSYLSSNRKKEEKQNIKKNKDTGHLQQKVFLFENKIPN